MMSLKNKTRDEVEGLYYTNKIGTKHYNAYAKRWNNGPHFGPTMRVYRKGHPYFSK
jgi:hypothetical protein